MLDHIDDYRLAINKLHRVLRPVSRELVVSVPMGAPGTKTNEYGFADLADSGHWRANGDDFEDRLTESGFTVQAVHFSPQTKITSVTVLSPDASIAVRNQSCPQTNSLMLFCF